MLKTSTEALLRKIRKKVRKICDRKGLGDNLL